MTYTINTNLTETINTALTEMDTADLIAINNEYCAMVNSDNHVYSMDDFNEIVDGIEPHTLARMIFYGDFNPTYDYFKFNGYGNLVSLSEYDISDEIYIDEIADYIVQNSDPLYNDEIESILEEYEETDED